MSNPEYLRKRRERMIAEHRCVCCGDHLTDADEGHLTCLPCRVRARKLYQTVKDERQAYHRARNAKMKQEGRCLTCGEKLTDNDCGRARCKVCRARQVEAQTRWRRKNA